MRGRWASVDGSPTRRLRGQIRNRATSRQLACQLDLTSWIGPGDNGCGAAHTEALKPSFLMLMTPTFNQRCISAGGAAAERPQATRAALLVNTFILFDITVLRLKLATAESTD